MTKPESKDYQRGVYYKKALAAYYEYLDNKNKELVDNYNELLEDHELTKQQNVDVHNEWKALNDKNKELVLCLENSTKIMEEQEGEVMDLVICQTMNNQIKWNRKALKK